MIMPNLSENPRLFEITMVKGAKGDTGSFGTPTGTLTMLAPGATPTITVTASGPDTAKIFTFDFGIPSTAASADTIVIDITGLDLSSNILQDIIEEIVGRELKIVKLTNLGTTMGDMNTMLTSINSQGLHVDFDVSAFGAGMYLTNIFIDTVAGVYTIFDRVKGRVARGVYDATKLLSMAIANAFDVADQSQIDNLQEQIDELGGKESYKDWSVLGDQIRDGTETIQAGDTTEVNWIKTALGVSSKAGNTVTCSDIWQFAKGVGEAEAKDYRFVYDGADWTYNEEVVDLTDFALVHSGTATTGEVLTISTTVDVVSYTFVGKDKETPVDSNVPHNWTLEQTYAPATKAFDAIEAVLHLASGKTLPAGDYYFQAHLQGTDSLQTRYFTIAADIEATDGAIQFAPTATNWTSPYVPTSMTPYKHGTTTTVGSAIALSETAIVGAVDVSTVDGITVHDSTYQMAFGNNCPALSNIQQWLDDESASGTFTPTTEFDRPSGYNFTKGFLYGIDPRVYALLQPVKLKFTAGYNNGGYTQGVTHEYNAKAFLLSMKEMSFNINTAEGDAMDLYSVYTNNTLDNGAVAARAKYNKAGGTLNSYRWSRSPYTYRAHHARLVTSTGSLDGGDASGGFYYAPAFVIGKSTT